MNAAQLPELAAQMPAMAQELWAAHEADPKMRPFALIDYTLVSDQFSKAKEFDKAKTVLEEAINRHPRHSPICTSTKRTTRQPPQLITTI